MTGAVGGPAHQDGAERGAAVVDGDSGSVVTGSSVTGPLVTVAAVRQAASRLAGVAVRTPLVPCGWALPGRPLWLKPESLQPIGSFKLRGAYNAALGMPARLRAPGLVTHSSGN